MSTPAGPLERATRAMAAAEVRSGYGRRWTARVRTDKGRTQLLCGKSGLAVGGQRFPCGGRLGTLWLAGVCEVGLELGMIEELDARGRPRSPRLFGHTESTRSLLLHGVPGIGLRPVTRRLADSIRPSGPRPRKLKPGPTLPAAGMPHNYLTLLGNTDRVFDVRCPRCRDISRVDLAPIVTAIYDGVGRPVPPGILGP